MYFTWNFILISIGIVVVSTVIASGWITLAAVGMLGLFWLLDFLLSKSENLIVERQFANPVYQGHQTKVELRIVNPLGRNLRVLVKDEPPFEVKAQNYQTKLVIPAGRSRLFTYEITTVKRGRFDFAQVNLRYPGKLKLFCNQKSVSLPQKIDVYPDLSKINEDSLAVLTGSRTEGSHPYRTIGLGGELAQLREFNPGDDYRKINWKVTAHTGKLTLNQFQPEKDQSVFLLLDAGRMLYDQLNQGNNRFDYILDATILLAYNIVRQGDIVGALHFNHRIERFVPPGKGMNQLQLLIGQLFDVQAAMLESDYRSAFNFLQTKINKRSLIFVYTDLTDQESSKELIGYLTVLSRHHLVVCVLLVKEYLTNLSEQPIMTEKDAYLKATALELLNERQKLKQGLANLGVKTLEVNSSNIKKVVVEHYLYLKRKGLF